MEFETAKCSNCGADLNVFFSVGRATCEACGNNYYIKNANKSESNIKNFGDLTFVFDNTENIMINSYRGQNLDDQLFVVSAVSYGLKKSYHVIISDKKTYRTNSLFKDNIIFMNNEVQGKIKEMKGIFGEEESAYNKMKHILMSYDFRINDKVFSKKETLNITYWKGSTHYKTEKSKTVNCSYEEHVLSGETMITPDYLVKHFNKSSKTFERIMNKQEISLIVESISNSIFDVFSEDINRDKAYIEFFEDHCGCYNSNVYYNKLGMENLNEQFIFLIVNTAIIVGVIKNTKESDMNILDLPSDFHGYDRLMHGGYRMALDRVMIPKYKAW